MSENPQDSRGNEQDLIEQIISQGLEKLDAPAQTATAEPPAESGGADAPHANRKSRRSAVYLYLLVLFGAAFLMLLLAYFIQQRNSENTISDLRNSMNLSREELLAEIRELEENNAELMGIITAQRGELSTVYVDLAQWRAWYEEAALEASDYQEELSDLYTQYDQAQVELYAWRTFWKAEQFYLSGDYKNCAAVIISQGRGQYEYHTPDDALQRYDEIIPALIEAGILKGDYKLHLEDYEYLLDDYFDKFGEWP